MSQVQTLWLPAPTGGEAPSLPPDSLADNVARELRNFLVHHPGRVVPRGELGGARYVVPTGLMPAADGGQILSAAFAEGLLSVSFRQPWSGVRVDPWRVPINLPQDPGILSQPSANGGALNIGTGTWTPIAGVPADSVQGPSVTRLGRALYTATAGGNPVLVEGRYAQLNAVRKVQLGGAGTVLTAGPRFVQAVFEHYGRLWAAAARRPGGSDYDLSQVFYTIPGGTVAATNSVTDWQDPVTGELNRIAVGAANDGDFVVGFGRAAGHLLIFKRNSVWIAYGTSPSNLTLRQLRTQGGCVDERSIVVADEGTYFASERGFELFDGTEFKLLSQPVSDEWLPLSNFGVASNSVTHAYIQASLLPNAYLHVSLGFDTHEVAFPDGTHRAWLLHRPTGSWVDVRTNLPMGLGTRRHVQRFVQENSVLVALSGTGAWARADHLTYGHDQLNGLADSDGVTDYDVDLVWRTGVQNLGGHWNTVQLHNHSISGAWHYVSSAADPAGWALVEGKDGSGEVLVPAYSLPGYPAPGRERVRPLNEKRQESSRGDLSLRLTGSSGAVPARKLAKCELYGMGVGYVVGRERHLA